MKFPTESPHFGSRPRLRHRLHGVRTNSYRFKTEYPEFHLNWCTPSGQICRIRRLGLTKPTRNHSVRFRWISISYSFCPIVADYHVKRTILGKSPWLDDISCWWSLGLQSNTQKFNCYCKRREKFTCCFLPYASPDTGGNTDDYCNAAQPLNLLINFDDYIDHHMEIWLHLLLYSKSWRKIRFHFYWQGCILSYSFL